MTVSPSMHRRKASEPPRPPASNTAPSGALGGLGLGSSPPSQSPPLLPTGSPVPLSPLSSPHRNSLAPLMPLSGSPRCSKSLSPSSFGPGPRADPLKELWTNKMTPDAFVQTVESAPPEQRRHWLRQMAVEFLKAGSFLRISNEIDMRKSVDVIVHETCQALQCDRATLFMVDAKNAQLVSLHPKVSQGQTIKSPLSTGIAGHCATTGEVLNVPDAYADKRFNAAVDRRSGYKTTSLLCYPVRNREGKIIAVIEALNKQNGQNFTPEDELILNVIAQQASAAHTERTPTPHGGSAAQVGISLENTHAFQEAVREKQKVRALLKLTRDTITKVMDTNKLIKTVIKKARMLLEADRASLFVTDKGKQQLWTVVADSSGPIRMPLATGIAGMCASQNKIVNLEDAYADPHFNRQIDKESGYRTKTLLCCPIQSNKGEALGVVQMINKKDGGPFMKDDEELLTGFCAQVALALETAALFREINDTKLLLEGIMGSINHLIITLEDAGTLVQANKDPANLLGIPRSQMAAQNYKTFFSANPKTVNLSYSIVPLESTNVLTASFRIRGVVVIFEDLSTQQQLLSTLGMYMSPELAIEVVKDGGTKLGGSESEATVLFTDLRDFTSLSEKMSPQTTVDLLNDYFGRIGTAIVRENGTINKFLGDGLMAVFGIPIPGERDAEQACMAALRIVGSIEEWNKERQRQNQTTIRLGIGINTGRVLSGNLGFEKRMEYTVVGDEVNTCSRIESITKVYGAQVLISAGTFDKVKDKFVTREVDAVQLVGKHHPIVVHELIAHRWEWDAAIFEFHTAWEDAQDPVSRVFLDRCRAFKKRPPKPGWSGVWEMDTK
eukprot:m51a1_g4142 putative guanylate cyclase (840) ;mRNA; f:220787-224423